MSAYRPAEVSAPALPAALSRRSLLAAAAAASASGLLAACGGGGDTATVPVTPVTPLPPASDSPVSYTEGVIAGFGSVIVGGVRFDDSRASLSNEDGVALAAGSLKLGMTIEVDADRIDRRDPAAATARALRIRLNSEVLGPVQAIDSAASSFTVLGQAVLVTTSTVFDTPLAGGLAALAVGAVVEVFGILDPANGRIVATRIESETAATAYKLRGRISELDAAAKTFKINAATIAYGGVPQGQVPAGLANGQTVGVSLQTAAVANQWVATALRASRRFPSAVTEAKLEGIVTAFDSAASFSVNGLPVNAATASFPDGTEGVKLGARLEVQGTIVNGVMQATTVEIEERRAPGPKTWDLRGDLGNLNTTAKTFALRGMTVWYGGTVSWRNGTEANLANGVSVRVHGVLSADRTRLEATRVEFR